jgi:DNA-binding transcriptional MerR regulator
MAVMSAWTLDELVRRAARVLAASDVRAPNGRVTELPDARVVRWYATKGLVDRPSGTRGRSALYGPRHLLQLVAVKRLQARGQSLAEIQARLAGATDANLRQLANLPTDALEATDAVEATDALADLRTDALDPADALADLRTDALDPADAPEHSEPALNTYSHREARFWAEAPTMTSHPGAASAERDGVLHGVALADGVLLLLPGTPNPDDLDAIRAASGPLIETLSRRGLTTRTEP